MVFADSVNLARRLSTKIEPDFAQEDLVGEFWDNEEKVQRGVLFEVVTRFDKSMMPAALFSWIF